MAILGDDEIKNGRNQTEKHGTGEEAATPIQEFTGIIKRFWNGKQGGEQHGRIIAGMETDHRVGELRRRRLGRKSRLWAGRAPGATWCAHLHWVKGSQRLMQVVFNEAELPKEVFALAETIRSEYVIAVRGTFARRTPEMVTGI